MGVAWSMFAVDSSRFEAALLTDQDEAVSNTTENPGLFAKLLGKKKNTATRNSAVEALLDELFESNGPHVDDLDKSWDVLRVFLEDCPPSNGGINKLDEAVVGQKGHQGGPMDEFGSNSPKRVIELSSALNEISSDQLLEYLPRVPKGTYMDGVIEDGETEYFTDNFETLKSFYKTAATQKQSILLVAC